MERIYTNNNINQNATAQASLGGRGILSSQMRTALALQHRIVMLYDYVCEDSIFETIYYLNKIRELDKKFHSDETPEPIEIQINSNGGSVEDGLSLISLIESMKDYGYTIITTNIGRAYSMGFLISLVGTERKAYRYAQYMYHDVSSVLYGKYYNNLDSIENINNLRNVILEIVLKYTNLAKQHIECWNETQKDKFWTAQSLLDIKGVDYIV